MKQADHRRGAGRAAGGAGARRRARELRHGALLRRRLVRHHRDHRGRDDDPRGARLRDQDRRAVGAGHLRRACRAATSTSSSATGCRRWRRHRALPRGRHGRDGAGEPRGGEVHAGGLEEPRDAGLKDFADIAKFADQLDSTIYGIEPGNDGNKLILDMIDKDAFGLGEFELKESSEQGMLAQAARAREERRGDRLPRLGAASDEQEPRDDLPDRRRRVLRAEPRRRDGLHQRAQGLRSRSARTSGKFLQNLVFSLDMENAIMGAILDDGEDPADAAAAWLKANPDALGTVARRA